MKAAALLLAAAVLAGCAPSAATEEAWSVIAVTATPFALREGQPEATQLGALTFVGGLDLRSPQARFGGFSDLAILADGSLLAISDSGEWLKAQIVTDPVSGAPVALAEPRMALMRDEGGEPFPTKEAGDSEDLAVLADGRVAVSFEQSQSLRIYDVLGIGPLAPALPGPPLTGTSRLGLNRGLEALAALGNGTLLVGAERGVRAGALPLWRVGLTQTTAQAPTDSLEAPLGYGLTALDALPDGRIFAVERFYAPGLGTRIRILTGLLPDPPGALALTELAVLAAPLAVDNLEGIAAVPQGGGAVRLYLLADNNFSDEQRTLLFVFDWAGPGPIDPNVLTAN